MFSSTTLLVTGTDINDKDHNYVFFSALHETKSCSVLFGSEISSIGSEEALAQSEMRGVFNLQPQPDAT